MLEIQLADTAKARLIRPDGRSERVIATTSPPLRSQELLYELASGARIRPTG
jgi:hypothetical protein